MAVSRVIEGQIQPSVLFNRLLDERIHRLWARLRLSELQSQTPSCFRLIEFASDSRDLLSLAAKTTLAPASTRAHDVAAPIPRLAPVTIPTLPDNIPFNDLGKDRTGS